MTAISDFIKEFNYARNMGITNDAGLMGYFRAEYKKNADGAFDYWVSTKDTGYMSK